MKEAHFTEKRLCIGIIIQNQRRQAQTIQHNDAAIGPALRVQNWNDQFETALEREQDRQILIVNAQLAKEQHGLVAQDFATVGQDGGQLADCNAWAARSAELDSLEHVLLSVLS